jgi:hypothetical protein
MARVMAIRRYDLLAEPRGEAYRMLIRASLDYANSFLLVVNPGIGIVEDPGQRLMAELHPYLLSEDQKTQWPGTMRFGDESALVSRFSLSPQTTAILGGAVEGLFEWIGPGLPEDLCILRADGSPWLVTISQERDAYLELRYGERATLAEDVPSLRLCAAAES